MFTLPQWRIADVNNHQPLVSPFRTSKGRFVITSHDTRSDNGGEKANAVKIFYTDDVVFLDDRALSPATMQP